MIIAIVEWGSTYSVIFLIPIETIPSFLMLLILFPWRAIGGDTGRSSSGGSGTTSLSSDSSSGSSYSSTTVSSDTSTSINSSSSG